MAIRAPKHVSPWITATLCLGLVLALGYYYEVRLIALVVGLVLFVGILLSGARGTNPRRR